MITSARTFAALRHRDYRLFALGQAVSLTGNWAYNVGESWLVYKLTGSTLALGAYTFVALLPVIPISLFGSPLIDRISKRKLVLFSQLALSATLLTLTWVAWSSHVQLWQLIVTRCLIGIIGSIDQPARQALIAELVPRDELPNGIALNTFCFNASRIVGPLLAGMAITATGDAAVCFLINGLAFLPFAGGVALVRHVLPTQSRVRQTRTGSALHGFDYLRRSSELVWLLTLMSVSSVLLLSYVALMPAIAKDLFAADAQQLSLLVTCAGLGATLGSLVLARVHTRHLATYLGVNLLIFPLSIVGLTEAPNLMVAAVLAVVVGFNTAWQQTIFVTLVQLFVRDDMRGRTTSTYMALSLGTQQAGGLQAGFLAQFVGVGAALRIGALISLLFTLVALWRRPALPRDTARAFSPTDDAGSRGRQVPSLQSSRELSGAAAPRRLELSGSLRGHGLMPVAQFLGAAHATGYLHVAQGAHSAELGFDEGRLVAARFEDERGLPALVAVALALAESTFAFQAAAPPAERDLSLSVDELRLRLAELRPGPGLLLDAVPHLDLAAPGADEREDEQLRVDRVSIDLLLAIDGRRSVRDVIRRWPVGASLLKLQRLVELGLIRLETPEPSLAVADDGLLIAGPPTRGSQSIAIAVDSAKPWRSYVGSPARGWAGADPRARRRRLGRRRVSVILVPVVLLLVSATVISLPETGDSRVGRLLGGTPGRSPDLQPSGAVAPQDIARVARPTSSVLQQALARASAASAEAPTLAPSTAPAAIAGRSLLDLRFDTQPPGWPDYRPFAAWSNSAYRLSARSAGQFVALGAPLGEPLADVTVRASLRKTGGPAGGGYGIILRDQSPRQRDGADQSGRYYLFEVSDQAEFGVRRREEDRWVDLVAWAHSDAVRPGNAPNELVARAEADRLTFTVNAVEVASQTDAALVAGGVGVFVGGDSNEVALDRLSVEVPR